MEVDNHISNTKYCLSRILANRGREPIYQKVVQAKTIQDLCDALQVENRGVPNETTSRGETSSAAKAAGGISIRIKPDIIGDMTHRHEPKITQLRGVTNEPPHLSLATDERKQTALNV